MEGITTDVRTAGFRMGDQIRRGRRLTDKPFAVTVAVGAGEKLKFSDKVVQVLIEKAVPVAIVSVGRPDVQPILLYVLHP